MSLLVPLPLSPLLLLQIPLPLLSPLIRMFSWYSICLFGIRKTGFVEAWSLEHLGFLSRKGLKRNLEIYKHPYRYTIRKKCCGIILLCILKTCCCDYLNREADWPVTEQDRVRRESQMRRMLGKGRAESGVACQIHSEQEIDMPH